MSQTAHSALILGASRGLGLALAQEYLRRGWSVTGTVRSDHTALHDLAASSAGKLAILRLEMNEPASLAALDHDLQARRFDLLFVNAGVTNDPGQTVGEISTDEFIRVMVTNALSPMRAVETLAHRLTDEGVIAAMSSGLGSLANNVAGGYEVYRASKAALNMLMRSYAARAPSRSLVVIAPGWVRTDMGGPGATLSIGQSIPGVVDAVQAQAGQPGLRYVNHQGDTVPW